MVIVKFFEFPTVDVVPSVSLKESECASLTVIVSVSVWVTPSDVVCDVLVVRVILSDLDFDLLPMPKTAPPTAIAPPAVATAPAPPAAAIPAAATAGKAAPPVAATTATLAIAPPTTAKPFPILPSKFSLLSDSVWPIAVESVFAVDSLCEVASPTDFATLIVCVSVVPLVLLIAFARDSFVLYASCLVATAESSVKIFS